MYEPLPLEGGSAEGERARVVERRWNLRGFNCDRKEIICVLGFSPLVLPLDVVDNNSSSLSTFFWLQLTSTMPNFSLPCLWYAFCEEKESDGGHRKNVTKRRDCEKLIQLEKFFDYNSAHCALRSWGKKWSRATFLLCNWEGWGRQQTGLSQKLKSFCARKQVFVAVEGRTEVGEVIGMDQRQLYLRSKS